MRATPGDAGEENVRLSGFTPYLVVSKKSVSLSIGDARWAMSFRAHERDR